MVLGYHQRNNIDFYLYPIKWNVMWNIVYDALAEDIVEEIDHVTWVARENGMTIINNADTLLKEIKK